MPAPDPTERRDVIGVLARLDRRVVPGLQHGARGGVRAAGAPLRGLRRLEDRLLPRLVGAVAAAWRGLALLVAVIAVLASAVHLQRYPELRQAERLAQAQGREQQLRVPGGRDRAGDGVIGPTVGADVDDYVERRRDALDQLDPGTVTVAVVSFDDYLTPQRAAELLPSPARVLAAQYRLPAEGERPLETEIVGGDLPGSIDRALEEALAPILDEIEEVRALLDSGTVDDPAFEADLERRLSEVQAVRNLVDSSQRVVFAVLVEAPAGRLQTLARQEDVRLVDPGASVADTDETVFYGLLPENAEDVGFGAPE